MRAFGGREIFVKKSLVKVNVNDLSMTAQVSGEETLVECAHLFWLAVVGTLTNKSLLLDLDSAPMTQHYTKLTILSMSRITPKYPAKDGIHKHLDDQLASVAISGHELQEDVNFE